MTISLRQHPEKFAAGAAALVLAGSVFWTVTRPAAPGPAAAPSPAVYAPAELAARVESAHWARPPAQSAGPGWRYELFTPPVIYYNPLARSFAVTPPRADGPGGPAEADGWQLAEIRRQPYRLQLAGYFGGPGDYLVAFTSAETAETLLGREGKRFPELGLVLRRFEVKQVVVEHRDAWPVREVAAFAVVFDERANAEVVLDSRGPRLTDEPVAVLRRAGTPDQEREVRAGDPWPGGSGEFRVAQINTTAAEIVLERRLADLPRPETIVLRVPRATPPADPTGAVTEGAMTASTRNP